MQPLVMQEWPYVLPPCPEWHGAAPARHSGAAHPLPQVRSALLALLLRLRGAGEHAGTSAPAGGKLLASAPRCLALNEDVSSPPALWLQSVSRSRARQATRRAGFQDKEHEAAARSSRLSGRVCFFLETWRNVSFC